MKYIDVEKLKVEIERLEIAWKAIADNAANSNMRNFYDGGVEMCKELLGKVDSLQQKQPKVDLEKEVVSICETYGITEHLDAELGPLDIRNIAHHFYELMNLD